MAAALTYDRLEVVVKISERCNINCTYCYMFNQANDEFKGRPAFMSDGTVEHLCRFLCEAARTHKPESVHIIFHGGEPMMMRPDRFDRLCEALGSSVGTQAKLQFSMQSNATLVNEDWLSMLIKHDVGVGVSLDGPREIHDVDRTDHRGAGTYDAVVTGLVRLQQAATAGLLKTPGAIAVIRPTRCGATVFDHLVGDLGIRCLSFLLPIDSHDSFDHVSQEGYGRYMIGVYRAWARRGDAGVRVRFIDEAVGFLTSGREGVDSLRTANDVALFVVASNGDLEPDDSLKPLAAAHCARPNIATCTLQEFLETKEMIDVRQATRTIPNGCIDCCWRNGCRGSSGRLINRFSSDNGFDNPSVVCDSLKSLYMEIAHSLIGSGYPENSIVEALTADGPPAMPNQADGVRPPRAPRPSAKRIALSLRP